MREEGMMEINKIYPCSYPRLIDLGFPPEAIKCPEDCSKKYTKRCPKRISKMGF